VAARVLEVNSPSICSWLDFFRCLCHSSRLSCCLACPSCVSTVDTSARYLYDSGIECTDGNCSASSKLNQGSWAQIFPSVMLFVFCPDLVHTAGQVIASNSVLQHQQGSEGSIIGKLILHGNSLGLDLPPLLRGKLQRVGGVSFWATGRHSSSALQLVFWLSYWK
jgi:hypothetical protein